MRYARTTDGLRLIEATRDEAGLCPGCDSPLVPKLGSIVVPHWAHRAGPDCDTWSEPESEWHRAWKRHAPPERTEVVMGAQREHRADVVLPNGWVLELQHSALSAEAIAEREAFYTAHAGGMIWLWDARRFWDSARIDDRGRIVLPRHRTLLLPKCAMFWEVPPHRPLIAVSTWFAEQIALLQEELPHAVLALAALREASEHVVLPTPCPVSIEHVVAAERRLTAAADAYRTAAAQANYVPDGLWDQQLRRTYNHARHVLDETRRLVTFGDRLAVGRASRAVEIRAIQASAAANHVRSVVDRLSQAWLNLPRQRRLNHVSSTLSSGTIAHAIPDDKSFRIEGFLTREQFAAIIRGQDHQ